MRAIGGISAVSMCGAVLRRAPRPCVSSSLMNREAQGEPRSTPTVRDLAGTLPLVVLSALTQGRVPLALGRFDETTGAVEVVDLSSPHSDCRVTLLEAE